MSRAALAADEIHHASRRSCRDMTSASNSDPRAEWLIPLVVASGLLIELMDSAALAIALPTIAQDFGADPIELRIALTAYLLTVAMLVCASAWLANRFGAKRLFITAMVVFVSGSICCGLSSSVLELTAARVLQGIGGAMMTPVGRSIVVAAVPRAGLVKSMGWFTMPAVIGPMLGPPLAGLLIETASWRWIFFINVPIGIAGIIAVLLFVPTIATQRDVRFDARGFALLCVAIAALILSVENGGFLMSWMQWLLASLGALAAWGYVRHSSVTEHPVLDLRLLRHVTLRAGLIAGSLTRISVGALPFLLPLLLQISMGLSPLTMSAVTVAMAFGTLSARFTLPPLIRSLGFRHAMMGLAMSTAILSLAPTLFYVGMPIAVMAAMLCVASAARAALLVSTTTLVYADVAKPEIGQATMLVAVSQQLSLGAGISLAGWLLLQTSGASLSLQPSHFILPFAVIAALIAASIPALKRMPVDAAAALRGNR